MDNVYFRKIHRNAKLPVRAFPGDAGYDLSIIESVNVDGGVAMDIHTGIALACPEGHYARLCARSSTFRKYRLFVIEGVIDAGFRGELLITVWNPMERFMVLHEGTRLAQVIIHKINTEAWQQTTKLPPAERNNSGFGSSGA